MNYRFYYHCLRRDLTNFSFLRHTRFSGFIVSMHQSGTHWLKHMLATAIASEYGTPMPQYNHANDIIGGPNDPRIYPETPMLASSHSIPNPLIKASALRRILKLPYYVILVRDMRSSLASNFEKWGHHYNCEFSEYLKGEISGKRFNHDIWWCIRFLNAWGYISQKFPEATLIVKYEDLVKDALKQLKEINVFLGLNISDKSLVFGIQESSKEKMRKKNDPNRTGGAVRMQGQDPDKMFSDEDNMFFNMICTKYLKYNFNYFYDR